jgi:hypothetical protein
MDVLVTVTRKSSTIVQTHSDAVKTGFAVMVTS